MKIGLFGGTFNPIHLGHVDMIQQVCEETMLEKVIFIPAYIPPHKKSKNIIPFSHRLEMAKLAISSYKNFEVSDIESRSQSPSYTFHTLAYFREHHPQDDFYYVMGVDSFNGIESWYHWQEVLHLANFIVIDRAGQKLEVSDATKSVLEDSPYKIYHLPLHTIPISSTLIREKLIERESVKEFLNDSVYQYIEEYDLYRW